jgi:hypothetical protein
MRRIITAVAIVAVLAGGGAILETETVLSPEEQLVEAVAGVPVDEFAIEGNEEFGTVLSPEDQ